MGDLSSTAPFLSPGGVTPTTITTSSDGQGESEGYPSKRRKLMAWRPRLAEQGEHEHEQDAVSSDAAPPPNSASPSSLYHPANSSREVLPILPSPIAAVDPLSPIDIGGIFTSREILKSEAKISWLIKVADMTKESS